MYCSSSSLDNFGPEDYFLVCKFYQEKTLVLKKGRLCIFDSTDYPQKSYDEFLSVNNSKRTISPYIMNIMIRY